MLKLCFGQRVDGNFRARVFQMCENLGWPPGYASWVMACIAWESGETFSPKVKNMAGSGATGLIQFMPATARDMGTTVEALAQLTAVEQLDYVERYFKPYAKKIKDLPSMYMAILMPKYVSYDCNAVIFSGGIAYRQNAGLDINKDGMVTKGEAASKVQAKFVKGMQEGNAL